MTSVPRRPYQRMDLRLATFVSRYGPRPARPDLPSPSVLLGTDAAALLSFSAIRSRGRKRTRTDRLTQVDNLAVSRANRSPPEGDSYIPRRRAVAGAEHSPSRPRSPPPHAGGRSPGGAPAGGPALNATEDPDLLRRRPVAVTLAIVGANKRLWVDLTFRTMLVTTLRDLEARFRAPEREHGRKLPENRPLKRPRPPPRPD